MPPINRRPSTPYRPSSRPSAPSYNRRANSTRRDIRMDNRRRRSNTPNWGPIIAIFAIIIVVGVILIISLGKKDQPAPSISPSEGSAESTSSTIYQPPAVTTPPVDNTPSDSQGGLIYTDDRVPNYSAANPVWEKVHFEWNRQDNRGTMKIDVSIDREMYNYYRSLGRYYSIDEYKNYINDANNKAIIAEIVKVIRDIANQYSYSDAAVVREVAKFVQDVIEYQYDSDTIGDDEYPRYPIETLYERQGDCEDTSILMAALLKELGYEVGFLHLPGHLAVALRTADNYSGGAYYEINGHRYLYIESTGSGWNIGDIPEDVQGQQATFYDIP